MKNVFTSLIVGLIFISVAFGQYSPGDMPKDAAPEIVYAVHMQDVDQFVSVHEMVYFQAAFKSACHIEAAEIIQFRSIGQMIEDTSALTEGAISLATYSYTPSRLNRSESLGVVPGSTDIAYGGSKDRMNTEVIELSSSTQLELAVH